MTGRKETADEGLESETRKWLSRLEDRLRTASIPDGPLEKKAVKNSMDNVNAYVRDCRHFLAKRDSMNAFEAVIYAWGIYETLLRMRLIIEK